MAFNNVIVKGFKKNLKLIGKGFAKFSLAGTVARQKVSTEAYVKQKLSTEGRYELYSRKRN